MVHRTAVLYRANAVCHLAFAAVAIVVAALSDADPVAMAIAALFVPVWIVLMRTLATRPVRRTPLPALRLASVERSVRHAVLTNLATLLVFVPVLLVTRRDGGAWTFVAILLGGGLGQLLVARQARQDDARDPAVLQTTWMTWRGRGGGRLAWPREWGDTAPAGATPPAS